MTTSYGKGDKAAATRLHSLIVRSRGRCEYPSCGSTLNLQCAHIIRRTYSSTRTDEANGWCLCSKHHFLVDLHPDDFMHLVDVTIGRGTFDGLKAKALAGVGQKFDWKSERARLKGLLDAIKAELEGVA